MYLLTFEEISNGDTKHCDADGGVSIAQLQLQKVHDELVMQAISGHSYLMHLEDPNGYGSGQLYKMKCIIEEIRKELEVENESEWFMFRDAVRK